MKKLTIDLGDGGIDRSIVKAAKKMITPRIDIASLTELSQCNIDMPKSVWRCWRSQFWYDTAIFEELVMISDYQ